MKDRDCLVLAYEDVVLVQVSRQFRSRETTRNRRDFALPVPCRIPEEVGNPAGDVYPCEYLTGFWEVHERAQTSVGQHFLAELVKPATTSEPARGNNHHDVP